MKAKRHLYVSKVKRLVVKVGSSLLTNNKGKGIHVPFLRDLAEQIRRLQGRGIECAIVTSGAISAGMAELGFKKRPKDMPELQALAAVGQSNLMHFYETLFGKSGLKVAQILLTREDISDRSRYSNARNTFKELFKRKIIPVVNENDTVAVEEIKFGDNDTLGVLVTHLVEADLLVLLTDMDGLFTEDPRINPKAKLVSEVFVIDDKIEKSCGASGSGIGTGGMKTKIMAARDMMRSGIPMAIANGSIRNSIGRLMRSESIGTFFYPTNRNKSGRK